jgi:hypothetical protein
MAAATKGSAFNQICYLSGAIAGAIVKEDDFDLWDLFLLQRILKKVKQ